MIFEAQLADEVKSIDELPIGRDCVLEPKLDGWRVLATIDEDGVTLHTRSGTDVTDLLPHVVAELSLLPAGTWLDGEVVSYRENPDGTVANDWGAVQSVLGSGTYTAASSELSYWVFDLPGYPTDRGNDIRSLPFRSRRKALESLFLTYDLDPLVVRLVEQDDAVQAKHDALVESGFEGSMVKDLDAAYASARRAGMWKIKHVATIDVILDGFDPKDGSGCGAVTFAYVMDGVVLKGRASAAPLKGDPLDSVGRVAEIAYNAVMPSGKLRHPRVLRVRPDKTLLDVAKDAADKSASVGEAVVV